MPFNIGDKVRFLNDVGGGTIVSQIDSKKVMVRSADGFDIPVLVSDLIADRPMDEVMRGEISKPESAPARVEKPKVSPHIRLKSIEHEHFSLYIGFTAHDESDVLQGPYDMYIINDSPRNCFVVLSRWKGKEAESFFAAKVARNAARFVTEIPAEDLFLYAQINIQALYYTEGLCRLREPEYHDIELKQQRFTRPGAYQVNRYMDVPLLLFAVRDYAKEAMLESIEDPKMAPMLAEKTTTPPAKEVNVPKHPEEIVLDLHMEALTNQPSSMSPKEILDFQINHFTRAMQEALAGQQVRRLVAIHGVGNGRLRLAVAECLRTQFPACEFQDASFKEYGYGATMIRLHRSK